MLWTLAPLTGAEAGSRCGPDWLGDNLVFEFLSGRRRQALDSAYHLGSAVVELPHPYRVVIPGNHDGVVEDPSWRSLISNATLLVNESVEIMGIEIWGSPATPLFGEAFGMPSDTDRHELYSQVPFNTDVLVTHGPPHGILDREPGSEQHAGCKQLLAAVRRVRPIIDVFGHIHAGYGTYTTTETETLFVNAALPGQGFEMSNRPHVFRLPRR